MMAGFPRLTLAARIMLGAAVFIVLAIGASTYFIVDAGRRIYLVDRGAASAIRAERNAQRFVHDVDALRRDTLFLTRVPPVRGIHRALNQGIDPEEGRPLEFWERRLQEIFSALGEARPEYYQLRYIGVADNGRELVRVDVKDDHAVVTLPEELQAKGDRDYFQATLKLKPGEVYLSEINLNREWGKIQHPHVRTLRASTPVFADDGTLFGMVVINMDAGRLIDAVTADLPPGVQAYLMNDAGDYLVHPDSGRTFGFDLGQRYTWQQDMPALQIPATSGGAGLRPLQVVSTPEGLLHMAIERAPFDPRDPDRFLLLAYALPEAFVDAQLKDLRNAAFAVAFAVSLSLGAVVFLLLRWTFAPLTQLKALAASIGAGRYDVSLPTGVGELGSFISAFRSMLDNINVREQEIRQINAQLQTVFENLTEGVAVSDLDGRLLYLNRAAVEMHGFAGPDEYLRRLPEFADTFELASLDGTVLPVNQWPLARVLRGEQLHDMEVRIRRIGTVDWQRMFSYGGALARDKDGQPLMAVVAIRDITDRKQAERRIQGQLEHLNLLDHITRAIGERQDLKSIFQVVVRSLENSLSIDFGCICLYDQVDNTLRVECVRVKDEELAGKIMINLHTPIDVDENGLGRCIQGHLVYEPDIGQIRFPLSERLARGGLGSLVMAPLRSESRVFGILVAARSKAHGFSSIECEFLRQLSEHVALAAHQAQVYGALQEAYNDLRQSQQVVMQQERLRALGQMASGIAHDINNALSPVSLFTESILESEKNLSERSRGHLQIIQRAVEDVAQTVARMRDFYRPRDERLAHVPMDVNRLIQQVVDFSRARWHDIPLQNGIVIHLKTDLAPDLPKIMGVESDIREALTNLVFNAVDAMPRGGMLTLRTCLADVAEREPASIVIEVSDDGIGMDADTRQRSLEPFFTTKGERGTGLGLAMVFGVVQRHNAEIEIDSAPGAGTTVRLVFAVQSVINAEAQAEMEMAVPSRLRLLLIDDDPILLRSLRAVLETDGHFIVTANGGEEGIAVFRSTLDRGDRFDAVVTDLGMPYVDGRKVAAAVKGAAPDMPVIMLTGWGQRLLADKEIPPHVDSVLAKPPKLREVRATLARLCQRPEAR